LCLLDWPRANNSQDYRLLSKASTQLKPKCDEILSMIGSLHMIDDHLQTSDLSSSNKKALRNVESWCHSSLSDLEAALTTARSKTGPDRFSPIVDKALDPTSKLISFVDILRRYVILLWVQRHPAIVIHNACSSVGQDPNASFEQYSRAFLVWVHHHLIHHEIRPRKTTFRVEEIISCLRSRSLLIRFEVISARRF
jgi:hypothetical protein